MKTIFIRQMINQFHVISLLWSEPGAIGGPCDIQDNPSYTVEQEIFVIFDHRQLVCRKFSWIFGKESFSALKWKLVTPTV